jgi:hypothetical protein
MKMTLLEIVQDILSDMDSDEVNSINDTLEAQQVMRIIRTTYDEIIGSRYWPHLQKLKQLEGLADTDKPTHMKIPEMVQYVEWIKYNKKDSSNTDEQLVPVRYLSPIEFLSIVHARTSSAGNIDIVYDDGVDVGPLLIKNDEHPSYWTTFDDEYVVFDSYDSATNTTLPSSKTLCQVYEESIFTFSDTFIPDLPHKVFPYLISESKSVAFNSIGQAPNAKEEQRSRRQRTFLARDKRRQNKKAGLKYPDYGRKTTRSTLSTNTQVTNQSVSPPDYLP